jgi:pimeloyl-ACP methyl ester carboxylesterase
MAAFQCVATESRRHETQSRLDCLCPFGVGLGGSNAARELAVRHPSRVIALVLTVPMAYKLPDQASSAAPLPPWIESAASWLFSSPDFLFWSALHISRHQLIKYVLATPPELLDASANELARVNAILDNVLPV